ncbi:MAG: TetR family transcriptional regulator [Flavobacteriaceae bacterium]|nr:MAG: TetR family transcriptional regulator [Flavobacteriaceae bacterium]
MRIEVKISLNPGLYLKNPQESDLGRSIIEHSILMIDSIGFEAFTFKKLALKIGSTEASIYRYFKNKHLLLVYLVSWYWEWVNYQIKINLLHLTDPTEKLKAVIKSFIFAAKENPSVWYVNESILHDLVVAEGMKAYHTKKVDNENSKGFFDHYVRLIQRVSEIILEVNPRFAYPKTMATQLFEMSTNHIYFSKHLPEITDSSLEDLDQELEKMLLDFSQMLNR